MMTLLRRSILFGCALLLMFVGTHAARAGDGAARDRVFAALPELERLARKAIEDGEVAGVSIAVIYRDETVYLKGFGLREAGKPELVDADGVF